MRATMKIRSCEKISFLATAVLFVFLATPPASANPLYSGKITGTFSDPQLTGNYLDLARIPTFEDDTASAVFSISSSADSAEVISGDDFGGNGQPSEIIFFGNSFSGIAPGQEFDLGT